jgi:hypothetical protein
VRHEPGPVPIAAATGLILWFRLGLGPWPLLVMGAVLALMRPRGGAR